MAMSMTNMLNFGWGQKTPVLLQTEVAECGLASLAMVASYHGFQTDLANLRQRFNLSLKGATMAHLVEFASRLNLATRALRLELHEMPQLKLPCILHWDLNHFVVLTKADAKGITIHDPAHGAQTLSYEQTSPHFTGVALEVTPTPEFKPVQETRRVSLRALMGNVVGLKRSMVHILALCLVLELFAVISPLFTQWVVDNAIVSADRSLITTIAVGFLLVIVMRECVGALRSWVVNIMGVTLNFQWLANVYTHMLRLPVNFFEKRHLGDVVSRYNSVSTIQRTLTTSFIEAVLDGLMAIVALGMMLLYAPTLAIVVICAVVLYAGLRAAYYAPMRRLSEEQIVHSAKQQSHFLESVRGVQSLKLFNREDDRRAGYLNLVVSTVNREVSLQRLSIAFRAGNGLIFGIEGVLILWLGAHLVLDKAFSIGMLMAFIAYKDQFNSRVASFIDKMIEFKMLSLQGERLADIVLTEPERDDLNMLKSAAATASAPQALDFKDLKFRYADTEPWVIQDISLRIEPGEHVAIVGRSGCGKTTLLKLMLGLLDPIAGERRVGDQLMHQLGKRAWRSRIGVVMQDDQLFAGSIAQNIAFFDPSADQAFVEEVAKQAAIHDEIALMPMAYQTLIGDMGTSLSGGQKQRILLARALYKKPQFLFLDEATSHLDVGRERQVTEAIKKLPITRITIAHRPETIASADRVIVIHEGRVQQEMKQVRNNHDLSLTPQQMSAS
jgi:ATP-binding cassette, subfamily B, bacterial CvaB/MchF/RaxB